MKGYARGESLGKFCETNEVLSKILDDPAVQIGMKEVFDSLTECLCNILFEVAKKKHLPAAGLLQDEPIVTYTLKLSVPTKEDIINDLMEKVETLKEKLEEED